MANLFDNLPLPVGNGPGTAVDVSAMGGEKTIICDGSFQNAVIAIEVSVDGGTTYAPLTIFQTGTNKLVTSVAADRMRANVSGRSSAFAFSASVNVGANDAGGQFAALPIPAGNGAGTAVDVSAFGQLTTFIVSGTFPGSVVEIQAAENTADFAPVASFAGQGGMVTMSLTADRYRTFVKGRAVPAQVLRPFSATAAVGAVNDSGGGGGGGNSQRFIYTATGAEGDSFPIALPAARANTNYGAQVTGAGLAFNLDFDVPQSGYTTTQITVDSSGVLTAGDKLLVEVADLTS